MMSLNVSESAKVVAILKQAKTVSRIRVAKHRDAIAHLRFLMDFLGLQPNTRQSVIETHETPMPKIVAARRKVLPT